MEEQSLSLVRKAKKKALSHVSPKCRSADCYEPYTDTLDSAGALVMPASFPALPGALVMPASFPALRLTSAVYYLEFVWYCMPNPLGYRL